MLTLCGSSPRRASRCRRWGRNGLPLCLSLKAHVMSCSQGDLSRLSHHIPDGTIPNRMLVAIAKATNLSFKTVSQHDKLLHENNLMIAVGSKHLGCCFWP